MRRTALWVACGIAVVLAYPAFDMIFVVVTRLREGRPVHQGGQDHTNHRLASVIGCPTRTVLLIWASGAALCAAGLSTLRLNQPAPTLLSWVLLTILLLWSGRRLSSVPSAPRRPPASR